MEVDLGPELREFQADMAAWIRQHAPAELPGLADWAAPTGPSARRQLTEATEHRVYREWESRLLEARLVCPQWPEAVGGRGWDGVRLALFNQECHRAGVPRVTRGMGESLVGPSVIVHGTDRQRARLLPRIIDARDVYCQGFSEPNHGSDLAGVETRGEVVGDQLVVTGQKVWTSGADRASVIFVLCRTDPDAPRHRNLSYVLVPLRDNHVHTRPLRQMSGASGFSEVFLDGALAPLSNVIGGLGNGWRVAMTTLGFERGGQAAVAHLRFEREFWELVETARARGRDRDPLVRQDLAWAYAQVQLMRFQGLRLLARLAVKGEPGPESSLSKLFWSEYHRRLGEIALDVVGTGALVRPQGDGYPTDRWQDVFLSSRAGTIYSGTSEIQRNIIAERVLGLPREPSPQAAPAAAREAVPAGGLSSRY
jgi:alkylation response protein AidB-like acyl-CoA dehydrogenase